MIARSSKATVVLAALALALAALAGAGAPGAAALVTRQVVSSFDGSNETGQPVVADAVGNANGIIGANVYVGLSAGEIFAFNEAGVYAGIKITGAKTPQGSFSLVKAPYTSGLAIDTSGGENKGDVDVADIEHGVIDRFNEKGHYLCQITGSATPSVSECNGPAGSRTPNGSIVPRGLAVDAHGNLYVADVAHDVIDVFGPSGRYLTQFIDPKPEPGALAVNASGDVYVANGEAGLPTGVVEFAPNGSIVPRPELEGTLAASVAVDPTSGDVLVGEPPFGISEFAAAGGRRAGFGTGGAALAVSASTAAAFANASTQPTITIYGPLEVIPEVRIAAASGIAAESATFNGNVTPDAGEATSECVFQYGTTTEYGKFAFCRPTTEPPYTEATAVSATAMLAPGTTYHFRLRVRDDKGTAFSADETVTTPGLSPTAPAISEQAANPSVTTASVRAQIAAGGSAASCQVQFAAEAQFEVSGYDEAASVPCAGPGLGAGYAAQQALASISGLQANTVYHYRFLATNATGTSEGEDETFATFGIKTFSAHVLNREGQPYTQAGGHPYKLVTNFEFNVGTNVNGHRATDANPKDIVTALPPGYIGNVNATPRCTSAELVRDICSPADQVGLIRIRLDSEEDVEPLFNLVPPAGYPAAFGFRIGTFINVYVLFKVRTGGDYGIDAESVDSSTGAGLEGATVEVWGVPGDPSHDPERKCGPPFHKGFGCSVDLSPMPLLTDPTTCTGPQPETLRADAWQQPGNFVTATTTLPGMTGCASVPFTPTASVQPTTTTADSPSGLVTNIRVPLEESPEGVEQADLRQTVLTLAQGMTVSPSAANGLEACSPEQFRLSDASEPSCPNASKLGSVEILTPVLPDAVDGSVYLAQQNANPFGSTLAVYLYAQADGAVVKLAGHVSADPATGQLTTTFSETPQLPFSSLTVKLYSGERASLATPIPCQTFSSTVSLTPWSGAAPLSLLSPFALASGCGGFAPSLSAGSASAQAGAYAPLEISFSRADGEQELSGLTTNLPEGLAARLAGVPLCSRENAAAGTCPEASRVGSVQAFAGPGSDPLELHGSAYLTGPYKGAPYGLSVVVPAIAGPFNLGTVVVRQALFVDEHDAHVTAVSDPLPTILDVTGANGATDGLPVRLRRVEVSIDRPDFTINPTNCQPLAISASFLSKEGASASTSSSFQIANCANLKFTPEFHASILAQASKANGVALTTKLTFPAQALGTQANVAKVKVALPLQLPSEEKTLAQACVASVFNHDPDQCPAASMVGHAIAHTPLLAEPLTGTAYLVSHAAEAFPSLVTVLHGNGITFDLVASTLVKNGITSSTFDTVPDVPVSSFELTFPAGPFSLLGANLPETAHYNFCGRQMSLSTTFVAQNGMETSGQTPIALTGCAKSTAKHVKHRTKKSGCRKGTRHGRHQRACQARVRQRRATAK